MSDNWDERYQAGKSYSGPFATHAAFETFDVDVRVTCVCGAEFDVSAADMPIQCTGCKRIYRASAAVEVGEGLL